MFQVTLPTPKSFIQPKNSEKGVQSIKDIMDNATRGTSSDSLSLAKQMMDPNSPTSKLVKKMQQSPISKLNQEMQKKANALPGKQYSITNHLLMIFIV